MSKAQGNCVFCYGEHKAREVVIFCVDDVPRRLDVCKRAARLFRDDITPWVNISATVEHGRHAPMRLAEPVDNGGRITAPRELRRIVLDPVLPEGIAPGAVARILAGENPDPREANWHVTDHARLRGVERGITEALMCAVAQTYEYSTPYPRGTGSQFRHHGRRIVVGVDRSSRTILTCWMRDEKVDNDRDFGTTGEHAA